jgi:hypothetical protein
VYGTITQWLPPPDPSGPVSCAICGCRLVDAEDPKGPAWRHFPSLHPGQDARGCRTVCVDDLHDRSGRIIGADTEHVAFLIDNGMDESLLPDREDAAAA